MDKKTENIAHRLWMARQRALSLQRHPDRRRLVLAAGWQWSRRTTEIDGVDEANIQTEMGLHSIRQDTASVSREEGDPAPAHQEVFRIVPPQTSTATFAVEVWYSLQVTTPFDGNEDQPLMVRYIDSQRTKISLALARVKAKMAPLRFMRWLVARKTLTLLALDPVTESQAEFWNDFIDTHDVAMSDDFLSSIIYELAAACGDDDIDRNCSPGWRKGVASRLGI